MKFLNTAQTLGILFGLGILLTLLAGCDKSVDSDENVVVGPAVVSEAPLEASVGQEYTYSVTTTGNPQPVCSLARCPAGMTIDRASGVISWVPTPDCEFDCKVKVVASNSGGSVSQEFMMQVKGLQIDGWETGGLVSGGIDQAVIRGIADDIRNGTYPKISSFLIIKDGKLVFEEYFNGFNRNLVQNIYSAEKSITSCLMGIAIDKGLIANEDELLYSFFPEYAPFENWSEWKENIRLKHLMTMTSGFELEGDDYDLYLHDIGPRDWIKFYLDLPVVYSPGSSFEYMSMCSRLVGHVVEREAQVSLPLFAAENLFEPLGMKYYNWSGWNPIESSMISSLLKLRGIDMAKIGQMYMDGGVWHGNRIVSEDWVSRSTSPHTKYYGYNWWRYLWNIPAGVFEVYYAFGNGGNSIFVVEKLGLVVVFTGNYFVRPDLWDNQYDLMKYEIIPAVSDSK